MCRDGSAQGEALDATTAAPDELRGTSIRNGQTGQIVMDELVAIHGVPQFLEVTNPFLHYVVNVR